MRSSKQTVLRRTAVFAPRFFVAIDGVSSPDIDANILVFDYTDNDKKADELVLTLNNSGMRFQDDLRFFKGNRVKVRWGYPDHMSDTRQLLISEIRMGLSGAIPVLELQALDVRHAMNKGSKATNWGAISSSAVAKAIAKRYGLGVVIPVDSGDARREARVQTADVTDIQYLKGLAEKLHWDCFVRDGKLHFHAKEMGNRPSFEFTYFTDRSGSLLSFSSELNLKRKPKTGVSGANPQDGKSTTETNDANSLDEAYLGGYSIDTNYGSAQLIGSPQLINDSPNTTPAYALDSSEALLMSTPESAPAVLKKQAKARQAQIALSALEARMEAIGTPRLRAREIIQVNGVGKAYSGNWRVTQVNHTIRASGSTIYSMSVSLKRNALSKGAKKDKAVATNTAGTTDVLQSSPDDAVIVTDVGSISSFSP